jgi:positive regulator of sigma E activity
MAWELLFGSDIGLMSLGVIVGVLVIGVLMAKLYTRKINEETQQLGK